MRKWQVTHITGTLQWQELPWRIDPCYSLRLCNKYNLLGTGEQVRCVSNMNVVTGWTGEHCKH